MVLAAGDFLSHCAKNGVAFAIFDKIQLLCFKVWLVRGWDGFINSPIFEFDSGAEENYVLEHSYFHSYLLT